MEIRVMAKDFDRVAGTLPAVTHPQDEFQYREVIFRNEEVPVPPPEGKESTGETTTVFKEVELRLIAVVSNDPSVGGISRNLVRKGDKGKTFRAAWKRDEAAAVAAWIEAGDTDA